MSRKHAPLLPRWAPRLPPGKILRLYELDALGIQDEDLVDEVGYALQQRCLSFLQANRATQGEAVCPSCSTIITHNQAGESLLVCPECGWQATWRDYFSTIQHKQLSGAEPVLVFFDDFVRKFSRAQAYPEKMFLVDRLLHGFHYYGKTTNRPVAVNLIDCRLSEAIALLDSLSYGPDSTPGLEESQAEWTEKSQNVRRWGK